MGEIERPAAPPEPRVELTNPDAPEAHVYAGLMVDFKRGARWSKVEVRRDQYGSIYLTAYPAGVPGSPLTLVADDLADLDANVEDLVRALAAFQAELAQAPDPGGPPSVPAGFGLTPEHRPAGPAPEDGAS